MKKIISTSEAPAAVGPYSQAVRVGATIYCAGQIPLDPRSGQIVSGDIAAQTRRVLDNITAVLKAEGLSFESIVKTTIFLTDLADFQTVNEIYGSYFKQAPPARSTVQVPALPKGARVEIEAIDDLSFGLGLLARVHKGTTASFQRRKVNGEVRLPEQVMWTASARVLLLRSLRLRGISEFSDYRKSSVDTSTTYTRPKS